MSQLKNFTIVLKGKLSLLLVALLGKSKGLPQPNIWETLSTAPGFGCAPHVPGVPSPASHHISVPSPDLRPLLKPNPALSIKKHVGDALGVPAPLGQGHICFPILETLGCLAQVETAPSCSQGLAWSQ